MAATAAPAAQTAEPLAAADGDDRREVAARHRDLTAADGAGERGDIRIRTVLDFLDAVGAGLKAGDDQRLVELQTAARAKLEGFAAGVAGAGDADGVGARRAAPVAAGLQHDLVDDEGRALRHAGVGILRGTGADGLQVRAACAVLLRPGMVRMAGLPRESRVDRREYRPVVVMMMA